MGNSGSLERMVISAYKDGNFSSQVGTPFTVAINADKYVHTYEINYNNSQAQGSNGASPRFNQVGAETIAMELVFDATGVVPSTVPGKPSPSPNGVADQIAAFKALVFDFNGSIHSPNYLKLAWGQMIFRCRLSSLRVTYTLFKPDGTPLRARAEVTFVEYTSPKTLELEGNKGSPDMTHLVTVQAGDTLPLLCDRIYGDSSRYGEVARVNGLTGFRSLEVGARLTFPPLGGQPQ